MKLTTELKIVGKRLLLYAALISIPQTVSAAYLTSVSGFVDQLITAFINFGNAIAIVMFIYGAIRYAYTADDPGGRKKGMGICVASVVALIIIQVSIGIMCGIAKGEPSMPATPRCPI